MQHNKYIFEFTDFSGNEKYLKVMYDSSAKKFTLHLVNEIYLANVFNAKEAHYIFYIINNSTKSRIQYVKNDYDFKMINYDEVSNKIAHHMQETAIFDVEENLYIAATNN